MGFMESNLELTPGPSAREFFHGGVTKVMVLPCSFCEVGGKGFHQGILGALDAPCIFWEFRCDGFGKSGS